MSNWTSELSIIVEINITNTITDTLEDLQSQPTNGSKLHNFKNLFNQIYICEENSKKKS